mgnify:CR=1 FL=1
MIPRLPYIVTRRPGVGAEILLPTTGPVVVAAGTPFGTFAAFVALATPANDTFMTRLQTRRLIIPAAVGNFIVEFAYGAGNTALDALRAQNSIVDPAVDDAGNLYADLNTFNTKIPAGQQLKARVSDGVAAANWEIWACGWDSAMPTFTVLNVAIPSGAGRYYPTNVSTGLGVVAGAIPTYGAWLQVVAAAPNDMLVSSVSNASSLGNQGTVGTAYQIGIGAAGAEVACGTFLAARNQGTINCQPPVWVKSGERLAIRAASTSAATKLTMVKVVDL